MRPNLYVMSRPTSNSADGASVSALHPSSSASAPELVTVDDIAFSSVKTFDSANPVATHSPERSLVEVARLVCARQGSRYESFSPIQRLFITHYRCHACGLMPLFYIDYSHTRRAKCKICNSLITFRQTGKFGKMRKEIARAFTKRCLTDSPPVN